MASKTLPPAPVADIPREREVLFKPFSWRYVQKGMVELEFTSIADFASFAQDVARGVETLLSIMERDRVYGEVEDKDGKPRPALLSEYHSKCLERLCIVSLRMLGGQAESVLEDVTDVAKAVGLVP